MKSSFQKRRDPVSTDNGSNNNSIDRIKPNLIGPKRALFQWLTTILIIGLPFIRVSGESLLRFDFNSLTLYAFGHEYPITDLSLFLMLVIAFTLFFLLVTLAFGRAWCGWACPQTSLVDFVEWLARIIGVTVRSGKLTAVFWQKVTLQCIYLVLAVFIGFNLVWYFVSPYDFFPQLIHGDLHWVAVLASTVYLDLAFLRRLFCKEFCPYGRFQTVLVDPGTLTLHYHPDEASRCIKCGACVRNCPTGIDIRNGYQVECINCGRCLDACRQVMAKRNEPGIIRYTFGLEGKGLSALLNVRMVLVSLATLGVLAGLFLTVTQRDLVSFKVSRNVNLLPRIIDNNSVANFFSAYLTNRTGNEMKIRLAINDQAEDLSISGSERLQTVMPGEKRRLDFVIFSNKESLAEPRPVDIMIVTADNQQVSSMTLYLTKPRDHHE